MYDYRYSFDCVDILLWLCRYYIFLFSLVLWLYNSVLYFVRILWLYKLILKLTWYQRWLWNPTLSIEECCRPFLFHFFDLGLVGWLLELRSAVTRIASHWVEIDLLGLVWFAISLFGLRDFWPCLHRLTSLPISSSSSGHLIALI